MSNNRESLLTESKLESVFSLWSELERKSQIQIQGNSMYPLIKEGDQLTINHEQKKLSPGDIIVFRQSGILVAHRVLALKTKGSAVYYLAKGDANRHRDPLISSDQIMGKVELVEGREGEYSLESSFWLSVGKVIATSSVLGASQSSLWDEPQTATAEKRSLWQKIIQRILREIRVGLLKTVMWSDRLTRQFCQIFV